MMWAYVRRRYGSGLHGKATPSLITGYTKRAQSKHLPRYKIDTPLAKPTNVYSTVAQKREIYLFAEKDSW